MSQQTGLLLYDEDCRLCVFTKARLEQLVRQRGTDITFLAYQSEKASSVLGQDYHPGRPEVAILVQSSGKILHGFDAFLPLVPQLPGGRLLRWVLGFTLVKKLADWGYRIVARHRYRWFGEAKLSR